MPGRRFEPKPVAAERLAREAECPGPDAHPLKLIFAGCPKTVFVVPNVSPDVLLFRKGRMFQVIEEQKAADVQQRPLRPKLPARLGVGMGGRIRSEGWPASVGIPYRNPSEYAILKPFDRRL